MDPNGEKVVLAIANTNVTGTERTKPQIRMFTEAAQVAYRFARHEGLRFFCFVLCTSNLIDLKFSENVNPNDYLVSLEGSFAKVPDRADLRSIFSHLEKKENRASNFFRIKPDEHRSSVPVHAAFIRIADDNNNLSASVLADYVRFFDNRPYLTSTRDGSRIVYQPSGMYSPSNSYDGPYPWNLLIFGAPGTGKSHRIQEAIKEWARDKQIVTDRITFFEDYTYQQFVGGYMPVPDLHMKESLMVKEGERAFEGTVVREGITYKFVPGPFASMLAMALASKLKGDDTRYVLIIEEINRANAASVFGDVFQLLDRDGGVSSYAITVSDEFAEYLVEEVNKHLGGLKYHNIGIESFRQIRIPDNLYIWATMNSADQGVFPLDSAFKRRWNFIYMDINDVPADVRNRPTICLPSFDDKGQAVAVEYDWDQLRKSINDEIVKVGFEEDRCIGYWFFTAEEMDAIAKYTKCSVDAFNGDDEALSKLGVLSNPLVDKLLLYLRQDVFRNHPTAFFHKDLTSLSSIRHAIKYLEVQGTRGVGLQNIIRIPSDALVPVADDKTAG